MEDRTRQPDHEIDALIAGGGPAGLTAALLLARARRTVLLVDAGQGRNRFVDASQGFFSRDGEPPDRLRAIGQEQVLVYPGATIIEGEVNGISGEAGDFHADLSNGDEVRSRVVVLATGVEDILPPIPGIEQYWGKGVFQCPFCDGWEHRSRSMAVLLDEPNVLETDCMYHGWSNHLTLVTNGVWRPNEVLVAQLGAIGVPVETREIAGMEGDGVYLTALILADGARMPVEVLWCQPEPRVRNELAVALGCERYEEHECTGWVKIDRDGCTSVPGVFAAGDMTQTTAKIAHAVSTGTQAASSANNLLIRMDFAHTLR
jgi:thioredoxin reductase